jgi:hypothetical protein
MKLLIRNSIIFLFLLMSLISCVNVKNKKAIRNFQLKIILTNKIGQLGTDRFPDEISKISMPLEPANCPKVAFLPNVEIIRYGLIKNYSVKLKTESGNWRVFFQKFYGNTGVETRKTNIAKAFDKQTIGDSLVMANTGGYNIFTSLETTVNSDKNSKFILFRPGFDQKVFTISNKDIPAYSNLDTLLLQMGKSLCDNATDKNHKIVLFYDPEITSKNDTSKTDVTAIDKVNPEKPIIDSLHRAMSEKNKNGKEGVKPDRNERVSQRTITFPNGDMYKGEVLNGKPDGNGTKTFKKACQISELDNKKQRAEAGDYLVGVWRDGEPQICKLYSTSGQYKFTISIGGE